MFIFKSTKKRIEEQITALSINERQCLAVVCFQRYCLKKMISHPDIDAFIEHVWKVAQLKDDFIEWSEKFLELAINGQGDTYPEHLKKAIPSEIIKEFDHFTQCIYEVSATCWFGAESPYSSEMLLDIFEIMNKSKVTIPKLSQFKFESLKSHNGWSPAISDEELIEWKAIVNQQ